MLATKLQIPPKRAHIIPRPRLTETLRTGLARPFTLVSAPIGFGKTTLLSAWMHEEQHACAWLALDHGDNDPLCFWHAVVAAFATVQPALIRTARALLEAPHPPDLPAVVTALINDIDALWRINEHQQDPAMSPLVLVLDDYHVIDAAPIHASLDFLLDHAPQHLHLVIASQTVPPLALPRYRSRQEMTEVGADDLRFTVQETTTFLNTAMALDLSSDEIAVLAARTEGWIAGLHLAVLSLQGHPDRAGFIRTFAGDDRYVLDFLMDEVFSSQPEIVQRFLLRTAILQRFCAPLCHAVVYGTASSPQELEDIQHMLDTVVQAHLFVIPLDHERQWYRYHRLFADALIARLHQFLPEEVNTLHRRAAAWLTAQGLMIDALPHIIAVGDFKWAGEVLEQTGRDLLWERGEPGRLLQWLEQFPQEVVSDRPQLCLLYAWTMYATGQTDAVEPYLLAAESRMRSVGDVPIATEEIRALMGEAIAVRALVAGMQNTVSQAIELSRWALDLLPETAGYLRGLITAALAEACYLSGDLATAGETFPKASTLCWTGENRPLALLCLSRVAEIQVCRGQLHQAMATCQEVQRLAADREGWPYVAAGFAEVQRGTILREWNELEAAEHHVRQGLERCQQAANPRLVLVGLITLARVLHAQGRKDEAVATLQQGMHIEQQHAMAPTLLEPPVAAYLARYWLTEGAVADAAGLAREHGWHVPERIDVHRAVEYVTLARLHIAQGHVEPALALLTPLQQAAQAVGYTACELEVLILQALARQMASQSEDALHTLAEALTLATPQGYVRLFVDEGAPMASLLAQACEHDSANDYTRHLLASFPAGEAASPSHSRPRARKARPHTPLSPREHEVLELIVTGLSNKDIARQLFLAPSTIKVHTRNIYTKLDVSNRLQATTKARSLGIIASP